MAKPESAASEGIEVRTYYVRDRNALVARADFSELYVDYYLHLHDVGERYEPRPDAMLKDAVAALTLHCASRPRQEAVAWTLSFQDPLLNLFVAGDSPHGRVMGRAFTEHVKERDENLFCADFVTGLEPSRRSVVPFQGQDSFRAVEQFYAQSEQRTARFFALSEEEFILITAQPGCDLAWLQSLQVDAVRNLDQTEVLSLLEQRGYHWECGCTQNRILELLAPGMKEGPESLFGPDEVLRVECPRCGKRYTISREGMEAFIAQSSKSSKPS